MNLSQYIYELPDSYAKGEASNNYKLLSLEQKSVQALRKDIEDVGDALNIYKAFGKTLDLYGEIYDRARGSLTDEQYRYIILQRVAKCMCDGTYDGVVKLLSVAFNCETSEFLLAETTNPCEVELKGLPYSVLARAGITGSQIKQIIKSMLPICVRLGSVELSGTFEFADNATTQDNDKGFGNIAQTVGGYFGYLDTDDVDIPT